MIENSSAVVIDKASNICCAYVNDLPFGDG